MIDVSFISLQQGAAGGARVRRATRFDCLALVKPQFEVGREQVGKGGVVRDPARGAGRSIDVGDGRARARRGGARATRARGCPGRRATSRRSSGSPRAARGGARAISRRPRWRSSRERRCATATVFTHRRPAETAARAGAMLATARARTGRRAAARPRGDRASTGSRRRPGSSSTPTVRLDVDICFALGGDGTILQRAAHLRRHRRARVRGQLRGDRVPRDGRPRGGRGGVRARVRGRLRGPGAARRSRCRAAAAGGWRSTTSRCTASPASASPTSSTRSAPTRSGASAATGWSSPRRPARPATTSPTAGPVMAWGVEGFVVSFIAPHSLTARALVVAPDDVLSGQQLLAGGAGRRRPSTAARCACSRRTSGSRRGSSQRRRASWPSCAGTSFYQRLREKFGRLASRAVGCAPAGRGGDPSAPPGTPPRVLHELRVENLLLMERAELRLAPGLNVLTGETGAGKTLLAHALDLLLGGRARSGIVRAGRRARPTSRACSRCPRELQRATSGSRPDAEELVLARRVWPDGRTRAYVCGRSATVADLRELGEPAAGVLRPARAPQADARGGAARMLDAHCGAAQLELRERVRRRLRARAAGWRRGPTSCASSPARASASSTCSRSSSTRSRPPDPTRGGAQGAGAERDRLRHLEALRGAAAAGAEAVAPDGEGGRRASCWPRPPRRLDAAGGDRPRAGGARRAARRRSATRPRTSARELRGYVPIGATRGRRRPGRLEEVEERLALFARLERKHGGSIDGGARATPSAAAARRDELEHADVALEAAERRARRRRGRARRARRASSRERRREAAPTLARAVRAAAGRAGDARRAVRGRARPAAGRVRPARRRRGRAADRPERRRAAGAAAGDRLGRRALAGDARAAERRARRRAAPGRRAPEPLLVFDEIDAGIGGHTARAVGEHLRDARRAAGRSCASPTCRRSRRSPRATSRSPRTARGRRPRPRVSALDGDAGRRRAGADARRRRGRPGREPARARSCSRQAA